MKVDGPGAPIFWRLASRYEFPDRSLTTWRHIVRIMAILTPRGKRDPRHRLHDRKRRFGAVLCDGGDSNWPPTHPPRAVISEQRLARFLAARGDQRDAQLERLARVLARSRSPETGLDCTAIAASLLWPETPEHTQAVARAYYDRLDRASRENTAEEGTT